MFCCNNNLWYGNWIVIFTLPFSWLSLCVILLSVLYTDCNNLSLVGLPLANLFMSMIITFTLVIIHGRLKDILREETEQARISDNFTSLTDHTPVISETCWHRVLYCTWYDTNFTTMQTIALIRYAFVLMTLLDLILFSTCVSVGYRQALHVALLMTEAISFMSITYYALRVMSHHKWFFVMENIKDPEDGRNLSIIRTDNLIDIPEADPAPPAGDDSATEPSSLLSYVMEIPVVEGDTVTSLGSALASGYPVAQAST